MDTIQIGRTIYRLDWAQARPPAHVNATEVVCGLIAPNGDDAGWVIRSHPKRVLMSVTAAAAFRTLTDEDRERLRARFGA